MSTGLFASPQEESGSSLLLGPSGCLLSTFGGPCCLSQTALELVPSVLFLWLVEGPSSVEVFSLLLSFLSALPPSLDLEFYEVSLTNSLDAFTHCVALEFSSSEEMNERTLKKKKKESGNIGGREEVTFCQKKFGAGCRGDAFGKRCATSSQGKKKVPDSRGRTACEVIPARKPKLSDEDARQGLTTAPGMSAVRSLKQAGPNF